MSGPRFSVGQSGRTGRRMPGLGALLRDDRGAVSLEFTVLVPFFMMMMVLFADATVVYLTHSEMFNVVRELSRRMSTGQIQNQDQAATYVADKLFLGERQYLVVTEFNGDKTATIEVDLLDAAIFGVWFTPLLGHRLAATATVGEEPRIE